MWHSALLSLTMILACCFLVYFNGDADGDADSTNTRCAAGVLLSRDKLKRPRSEGLVRNIDCGSSSLLRERPIYASLPEWSPKPLVTLGVLYYCNDALFRQQLSAWSAWPMQLRQQSFFLVIDDGSPPGAEAVTQLSPELGHRLRIAICHIRQDIAWNIGGARNLLFTFAPTEYVMMLDMDVIVPMPFARKLPDLLKSLREREQLEQSNGVILTYFPRFVKAMEASDMIHRDHLRLNQTPHPAIMLLRRSVYWAAGGCDEDFVGSYGSTDPHFRWRAKHKSNITVHSQHDQPLMNDLPRLEQSVMQPNSTDICPELNSICPCFVKNSTHNKLLMKSKMHRRVPWSDEYLRFTWEFPYGVSRFAHVRSRGAISRRVRQKKTNRTRQSISGNG